MEPKHGNFRSGTRRRWLVAALAFGLSVGGVATVDGAAGAPAQQQTGSLAQQQAGPLVPFEAVGLPAGQAMGVPSRLALPAGTNLKHVHGGPTYVYVLSGSLDIIDGDGSQATYISGDFFAEAPGHIHTLQVAKGAEVFVLQFLPPGAEATVPVQ